MGTRSDTRSTLRSFFEADSHRVIVAVLVALAVQGRVSREKISEAIARQVSKRTRTPHGFVEAKLGVRIMSLKRRLGRVEKGEIDSRRQGLLREYAALGQNRFVRAPTA